MFTLRQPKSDRDVSIGSSAGSTAFLRMGAPKKSYRFNIGPLYRSLVDGNKEKDRCEKEDNGQKNNC